MKRHYTLTDKIITELDHFTRSVFGVVHARRDNPAHTTEDIKLSSGEKNTSASFMRVNHTGEICAQALYRGQAICARNPQIKSTLEHCGEEEVDHLAWCYERLKELDSHRSYLNVFWYWNSFFLGVIAGIAGDRWSLGFVEETEKQVEAHLDSHLAQLPTQDLKSRRIVAQMKEDEIKHGETAHHAGAESLPNVVKKIMTLQSKVMTTLVAFI